MFCIATRVGAWDRLATWQEAVATYAICLDSCELKKKEYFSPEKKFIL
jgi:hypothetical protein